MKPATVPQATTIEIHRFATMLPFAVPRCVAQSFHYKGHYFPKGANVMANYSAINYNPRTFPEPDQFRPERFLTSGGEFVGGRHGFTSDQVANFGSGKRECMGKLMAEKQFFLFFAGLLHKFEFCRESGTDLPDVSMANDEKNRMYIRRPPNYKVVLKSRH